MIFTPYAWPFSGLDCLLKVLREISPPPPPCWAGIPPPGTAWLLVPPFSSQSCSSCPLPGPSVQAWPSLHLWTKIPPFTPWQVPGGLLCSAYSSSVVGPSITLITLNTVSASACQWDSGYFLEHLSVLWSGKSPRQRAGANVGLGVFPSTCGVQCLKTGASYNLSILQLCGVRS